MNIDCENKRYSKRSGEINFDDREQTRTREEIYEIRYMCVKRHHPTKK